MEETFEPIIVCYCCQWCSYAAADLAGSMRLQYPTNVRIIKVPCTGRVDIIRTCFTPLERALTASSFPDACWGTATT